MVKIDLTNSEAHALHICLQVFLHEFPNLDQCGDINAIDNLLTESLIKELKSDAERIS